MHDFLSVDRRRRRLGLRPITVVILAVLALLVVAGLAWGVSRIVRATAVQPLVAETATPRSDVPTPTPTIPPELYPVTWTVRLDRDSTGRIVGIVDDPAVQAAVRAGFLEAWAWAFASTTPHNPADAERYLAPLPGGSDDWVFQPDTRWWYGLEAAQDELQREASLGMLTRVSLEDGRWSLEVVRFSADGSRAVVRGGYVGGTCAVEVINTATGEVAATMESRCLTYTAGLVYDARDGRWRIAALRQTTQAQPGME